MSQSTATIPALASWTARKAWGQIEGYRLATAVGQFSIAPVMAADGIHQTGWALRIQPELPYGVQAKPYQIEQVNDVRKAADLRKAAQQYAGDRAQQLRVKQACLDA